ncbi:zinc finger protein 41 homolog [Diabrotica virgifera virgifera]|uniref:Zinc finger protein 41 homolog n=1 Tax=Diabrotica virgifera virgifera TaxID=50390 RepID=A0A6P7GFB1_DIAVI|nr:zinc finger protein 41 homolog [Diabrotica virgifera virgifera]
MLAAPIEAYQQCYPKIQHPQYFLLYEIANNEDYPSTMHYPGFPPLSREQQYEDEPFKGEPFKGEPFREEPFKDDPFNPSNLDYATTFPPVTVEEQFQKQYYEFPWQTQPMHSVVPQPLPEIPQPLDPCIEPCTDDYNCKCDSCQNKYGSLPILLQGIEQKAFGEKSEPEPSTSSHSHTPRRILTCEYCKKTFTHKGDFKKHLRKHTKEKPYSCRYCNKCFGNTSNLLRHQKLHTGEKPFACEHCDKRFSRKDKLDCHRRSRTCQEASTSRSYLE